MALDPADLANDIKNDTSITENIPEGALATFENFADRLSIHITAQIQRGTIDDVEVSLESGAQTNESNVK